MSERNDQFIWAQLVHLGYRMWQDNPVLTRAEIERLYANAWAVGESFDPEEFAADYSQHEDDFFDELTQKIADSGLNMVVIDLGEGVRYDCAPELAMEGSWSKEKLADELARLRGMGLEPIPKLNFSARHDLWLGEYERMVSSPEYYRVCSNLIAEVCELFDTPRFFHIGFDEETMHNQRNMRFAVIRQGELWNHDFLFFVDEVEKHGVRAWCWADKYLSGPEEYIARVPRSVLQSVWYYGNDESDPNMKAVAELDKAGFEQVVCGSNCVVRDNIGRLVERCDVLVSGGGLKGYMQSVWRPTLSFWRDAHFEAIRELAAAKARREAQKI